MIGYWILIGLKKVLWDNNLEFSQGDILIGLHCIKNKIGPIDYFIATRCN